MRREDPWDARLFDMDADRQCFEAGPLTAPGRSAPRALSSEGYFE
jgi:hypothetical protein